jgi:hypothetical protein
MSIGITYLHLTGALAITAVSAENPLSTSPLLSFLSFLLTLGLIFLMAAARPGPYKYLLFALFSALIGQSLAPLVQRAEDKGVLREVLASVAGIFLAMSLVGFLDNQNFLGFGGYLLAALIGLIVARVVLIFFNLGDPSPDVKKVNTLLNWVGTALFAVFVAYDTQILKKRMRKPVDYVDASLGLFLDIINLFSSVSSLQSE